MELLKSQKIPKNFTCNFCYFITSSKKDYDKHLLTLKHLKRVNGSNLELLEVLKIPKNPICYTCDYCYYFTNNKKDHDKHLLTLKHIKNIKNIKNINTNGSESELIENKKPQFICECNKKFITQGGFWKHKQTCKYKNEIILETPQLSNELIIEILKQNQELIIQNSETQKQNQELANKLLDVCKNNITSNTLINSNNNSHNKTFNLQFFLNETCKDAMNIMDFVDSVKLQLSDLENVGKLGYIDGISDIIVKNLKALDVEKRPVHCTDSKREVMYVKDDGKWYNDTKEEDQENKKLKRAIKRIANKNSNLLSEFKAKYPDCIYSDSTKSDQYNKIIIEALGGSNNNEDSENKIIKKIAREVIIQKE